MGNFHFSCALFKPSSCHDSSAPFTPPGQDHKDKSEKT